MIPSAVTDQLKLVQTSHTVTFYSACKSCRRRNEQTSQCFISDRLLTASALVHQQSSRLTSHPGWAFGWQASVAVGLSVNHTFLMQKHSPSSWHKPRNMTAHSLKNNILFSRLSWLLISF